MQQIEAIRNHPLYVEHYDRLLSLEEERIFCRHEMTHFLDVARIAYILNLEEDLGISKEVIYAAAILHDIGKDRQYTEQIPHEIASAQIAERILRELPDALAFSQVDTELILGAIRSHRKKSDEMNVLENLLYRSDKMSRMCFACKAERQCNWSDEKKNMEIEI